MPVHTLADAASFHAHQHRKITARVAGAPAAARGWRPAPGKWSALEHLEHVAMAEAGLLERLAALAALVRAQNRLAAPGQPRTVDALPALFAAGAIGTAKVAPPDMCPTGRPLDAVLALLATSRQRLEALLPELEQLDTDSITEALPVAKAVCTLGQWVHFLGIHMAHHDRLIQGTLEAWNEAAGP